MAVLVTARPTKAPQLAGKLAGATTTGSGSVVASEVDQAGPAFGPRATQHDDAVPLEDVVWGTHAEERRVPAAEGGEAT